MILIQPKIQNVEDQLLQKAAEFEIPATQKRYKLSKNPTTTIGLFPQTKEPKMSTLSKHEHERQRELDRQFYSLVRIIRIFLNLPHFHNL